MPIPIIDLFAGPGGLGEGFSSLSSANGEPVFKIKLSIEKDEQAHRTLSLRAFFRQFPRQEVPQDYYDYLAGKITRNELFSCHPVQTGLAEQEAWLAELGAESTSNDMVDERIRVALDGAINWVLIGGPPCQAYSLVGRSRIRGENTKKNKKGREKYENDHRHFLYREYLRILAIHRPPVFVMENVKGLLSAEVKNQRMFESILSDLADPLSVITQARCHERDTLAYRLMPVIEAVPDIFGNYPPKDFVVHAEEYGMPQARHRVIILGIRSDLAVQPRQLTAVPIVSIEQVIDDLPKLRSGLSKEPDSAEAWRNAIKSLANAKWFTSSKTPKEISEAISGALGQHSTPVSVEAASLYQTARHPENMPIGMSIPNSKACAIMQHVPTYELTCSVTFMHPILHTLKGDPLSWKFSLKTAATTQKCKSRIEIFEVQ